MTNDVVVGSITLGDIYQRLHHNFTSLGVVNALMALVEKQESTLSLEEVSAFAKEALEEMKKRRWVTTEPEGACYEKTPYGELYSRTGDVFNVVGNLASSVGIGLVLLVLTNDIGLGFLALVVTFALIVWLPVYDYYEDVPHLLKPWRIKTRLGFAIRVAGILGWFFAIAYAILNHG